MTGTSGPGKERSLAPPVSPSGDEGPVGPFPSWGWLYGVVVAYGVLVILLLALLTRVLDPGAGP